MLVCEIRLKRRFVDQVSVNSRKAGRRDFCQSILTYRLEPMCAVKINMPRIFKRENRPNGCAQCFSISGYCYPSVVVLLLFQIKLSSSGLDIITHPMWMICKCFVAWCRWRLLQRMQTRSCSPVVGDPTPQENQTVVCLTVDTWSQPCLTVDTWSQPCRSWKRRFGHILLFLLITKWQNLLTVVNT